MADKEHSHETAPADEQMVVHLALWIAKTGNDYADMEEGISGQMATEIARALLPLVKAARGFQCLCDGTCVH